MGFSAAWAGAGLKFGRPEVLGVGESKQIAEGRGLGVAFGGSTAASPHGVALGLEPRSVFAVRSVPGRVGRGRCRL
jgi:hypothetical protein